MPRASRSVLVLTAVLTSFCAIGPAEGQVPIPLQEQIRIFNTLPAAQQQSLIRELQRQLPPAQREAVIGMLQQPQGGGAAGQGEAAATQPAFSAGLDSLLDSALAAERLQAGDTLVISFATADASRSAFVGRLNDANPYKLDLDGVLHLPGVAAIELAGLDADQARTRLGAEAELRSLDVSVTLLPLDPVGTAALTAFGYDLFRDVPSTFAPATDIPVPVDYVIGPGDTVNVQLFGNQNAEYFLPVSREGTINFPEIGPLNVSGLTFTELRNTISDRVSEQMIGVRASTTLGELRSIRIFVLGDVERPGSYTVSGLATMTNALFASGGVKQIGSLRKIGLMRDGATVSTLDLYDLLLRGDTRGDARLQPGDVIFVPPIGPTVAVDGEVRRPAVYELRTEQRVDQLVTLAGGLNATANRSAVKLERIVPGRGVSVADLDLAAAAGAQQTLRDGDVLRVEPNLDQLEDSVRLVGNVQRPGLYQWRPGMRMSDLLPNPELVRPQSDLNYVLIRREVAPNVEIDVLSADLQAIWERRAGAVDLDLLPRDTVHVFHLETGRGQYIEPILEELQAQARPHEPLPVVRVGGQVRAAGQYPLEPGMRVSDLLRAGGGLSAAAYAIDAELTRYAIVNGEYRETELRPVDLAAMLGGDAGADFALASYDYLNVKEIPRWAEQENVTLIGEVTFPGTYPIRQGETLSSMIERAGGLTDLAFPQGSVFTRVELREREREQLETLARRVQNDLTALSISDTGAGDALSTGQTLIDQLRNSEATGRLVIRLDELIGGRAELDIVLKDGDQLIVPQVSQEVTVIGEVQYPTSHIFEANLERRDYIDKSGGLTARADTKRIYVVRANGEVVANTGSRWFRRDAGIAIRPGDTIVVPLDVDRGRAIARWAGITQTIYNLAIAAAAVNSF